MKTQEAEDLVEFLMVRIDDYAEAKVSEAGYEPARPKAVEHAKGKRLEVVRTLMSLVRDLPDEPS